MDGPTEDLTGTTTWRVQYQPHRSSLWVDSPYRFLAWIDALSFAQGISPFRYRIRESSCPPPPSPDQGV